MTDLGKNDLELNGVYLKPLRVKRKPLRVKRKEISVGGSMF